MTFTTRNHTYTLKDVGDGGYLISGHPEFCPTPTLCTLAYPPTVGRCVFFQRIGNLGEDTGWTQTTVVKSIDHVAD